MPVYPAILPNMIPYLCTLGSSLSVRVSNIILFTIQMRQMPCGSAGNSNVTLHHRHQWNWWLISDQTCKQYHMTYHHLGYCPHKSWQVWMKMGVKNPLQLQKETYWLFHVLQISWFTNLLSSLCSFSRCVAYHIECYWLFSGLIQKEVC